MIKNTLINFSKRVYFALWWRSHKVKGFFKIKRKKNQLVFAFVGRNDSWPALGRDLYKNDAVFREIILECNSILTEFGGSEILSYFEGPENSLFYEDESKFTCITAIQIATLKIYNDQGIYPNAVIGVSQGEPAAAYAAGALTLKETLRIVLSYAELCKLEKMEYAFLLLNTDFEKALEFCRTSPVFAEVIYENSPQAVLITCHKKDVEELKVFSRSIKQTLRLIDDKTYFPYHTSVMKNHDKMLKQFIEDLDPKPLRCDYYSPTLGKKIPRNKILEADYWTKLIYTPVRFHKAVETIIKDGHDIFLQVGPPVISEKLVKTITPDSVKILNSFETAVYEPEQCAVIYKQLAKINFERSYVSSDKQDAIKHFREDFNPYTANSDIPFEYLRKNGPIHFLPKSNVWLVLNYDDIEQALRAPDIYSSSIIKEYDPILLGADPEEHKVMRDLLQPLFSPAVINELAEFTAITATSLLGTLCKKDSFDFVKDYSDPLSLFVLCHFFRLSTADADRMIAYTGKDYNDTIYWQRLEEFFKAEFETCVLTDEECLWGKLRDLTARGEFVLADAVSLLKIVWTAGMATTSALMSSSINYALNEPEITTQLLQDEKFVSKFIEECLRLQPPLGAVYRITTQPVILAGQQLNTNTTVLLHLRSGMLDPAQYVQPDKFSISRPAKRHLAFGAGIHQCIGMGIARAEARSALQAVLQRLPDVLNYSYSEPEYIISDLKVMSSLKMTKKIT